MISRKKINRVQENEFTQLYEKQLPEIEDRWQELFSGTIQHISHFSITNNFWFIADFKNIKVVEVGGKPELLSPLSKKQWLNLPSPSAMEDFFHPSDVSKMKAFTVFYANYISSKNPKERKNIKVSMIFRMMDANKVYTWRIMQYPEIFFSNGLPRFLLCLISDYNHLLTDTNCSMFILDENKKESIMYFCEDEKLELRTLSEKKQLSKRELEIVKLLAKGLISKEVAAQLNISKNTIENHKQNIFSKTKTKNLAELIAYAHTVLLKEL